MDPVVLLKEKVILFLPMKPAINFISLFLIGLFSLQAGPVFSQACTTLGQTPSTAFPVCGITVFKQTNVPYCKTNDIYVPGCSNTGNANYANKNPFFYKFTCFTSGTLGFLITPLAINEDYDWQLYDITGHDPNDIFTDRTLVVSGNWSGSYGTTGASSTGVNFIQCASDPTQNLPKFATMPTLIAGHQYLLMISHYSDTPSGYDLSFGGGTAVITDPLKPKMLQATPDCDGKTITLKLNKKILCTSLSAGGSEFSLLPATASVMSVITDSCSFGFDFSEMVISLNTPLTSGTYQLVINNGTDQNTLSDNCGNLIAAGELISFDYKIPQSIQADSVGKPTCATDSVLVYYPKKIKCSTISPSGSDFSVTGPAPVTIISATGNCVNDLTDNIIIKLASPVYTKGNYSLSIQPGLDGSPIFDICGQPLLPQLLSFTTADTVSAMFSYSIKFGCQKDTLTFNHNGANDVNGWKWNFNNNTIIKTQAHTVIWSAASTNNIQLNVTNGVCKDSATATVVLDNEVKANFSMTDVICPEDPLTLVNESTGQIDSWQWNFGNTSFSNQKDPTPVFFPKGKPETKYSVVLAVSNNTLGCTDSVRKTITVLDLCFIAVPSAFTPNNDGLNDYFAPHNALKADNYDFQIYNRWGQRIFKSRNWKDKWDGKVNGVLQAAGVYVWMLSYTHRETKEHFFKKGTVTLIR